MDYCRTVSCAIIVTGVLAVSIVLQLRQLPLSVYDDIDAWLTAFLERPLCGESVCDAPSGRPRVGALDTGPPASPRGCGLLRIASTINGRNLDRYWLSA